MRKGQPDLSPYPTPEQIPSDRIEVSDLKGTTLRIYYFLAEKEAPVGPREVQRALGLSTPSLALYHLKRLSHAGLVKKRPDGQYYIEGDPLRLGELKDHVKIAGTLVPRILLYAYHAFLSIIVALFLYWRDYSTLIWLTYVVSSSLIFAILLIRDARLLYGPLVQKKS